ncbi:MAG: hypothetical protein R3E14_00790 [Erythrobacter sp.]
MSEVTDEQIADWRSAIGRKITEKQPLDRLALQRYSRAVGLRDEGAETPLPHWAFFLPSPLDSAIGEDGHPMRGDFLPAITLPRRMFAAATILFESPLETGLEGELTSEITEVAHKSGRTGELVFVEVTKTLSQSGSNRVQERQTYVYRGEGGPVPMPVPSVEEPQGEVWHPSEVNLFRFSAATYNGHRIHYDRPYATAVEGYPALVVHGPFTAARLAGLAMRDGQLASFSFRAIAPLFLGQKIYLRKISATGVEAVRCDGVTAMQATVSYR